MAPPITIAPLESTSPTAAARMAVCGLMAGLSSSKEADGWVLHNPRLWLGIAFHSLLEIARSATVEPDLDAMWQTEVDNFLQKISSHRFDNRFSNPERWPDYYLIKERALSAASELPMRSIAVRAPSSGATSVSSGTERRLVARSGKLIGRPDRFDRASVTDFKSNLPDQATAIGAEIFQRNRRQIKIYAAMIAEALGFWPRKGIISGGSGETIIFDLLPSECDAEADNAVAALEVWNRALSAAAQVSDIASPSDTSCGGCRFQLICPAFWAWLPRLPPSAAMAKSKVAVTGILNSVQLGNDGDLQTIGLSKVASTQPGMTVANLVTRRSIHGTLPQDLIGTECRIVGAQLRRDGRLVAGEQTAMMPASQLPEIAVCRPSLSGI